MKAGVRFITDHSLAGVARWLRLCGFDTVVFQGKAGRAMMRQAQAQERILLTRRRDMQARQVSGRLLLMQAADPRSQLKYILESLSLQISRDKMLSICLVCNHPLEEVPRPEVRDLVPPFVFENHEKYTRCPRCERIYWEGSHVCRVLDYFKRNGIGIG